MFLFLLQNGEIQEIMGLERKYLDAYKKRPVMTDLKYFFKAASNILLRGARST